MPAGDELEVAIAEYHAAAAEFVTGDPERYKAVFSQRDDVCVANPFRPISRGWAEVSETIDRASKLWREGEVVGFDRVAQVVTPELAHIVEFERFRAKIGDSDDLAAVELRVTSIFRREQGTWKVVHRHADPITTPQPAESVIRR